MTKETGGPAFPHVADLKAYDINTGNYSTVQITDNGMFLRDWFAGMALQGLIPGLYQYGMQNRAVISSEAYEIADAMIKEREGK